ncbi:MAG: four helix bundle protein [Muribaculaceae bacterium]|nr:four helix bundle protein [Muribaculaceae bacterium]
MAVYSTHKELSVWKKSIQLVKEIYLTTQSFPSEERFGIVNQMRRAAVSIPSNIAEGYGRKFEKERSRFLNIALGSASELETQVIISGELSFVDEDAYKTLINLTMEVIRMLASLIKTME